MVEIKYTVAIRTRGYYISEIEANSIQEAKRLAEQDYASTSFGPLDCIDGETYSVTDENDNTTYFY